MVSTSFNAAANAYATAARSITGSVSLGSADNSDPSAGAVGSGPSFADLIKQGVTDTVQAVHKSEEMSKAGLSGKADVREVVAAVNNAELTLQTVTAVRDKVVSAYNEILRMPI